MLTAGAFAGLSPVEDFEGFLFECRGSVCALWVPAMEPPTHPGDWTLSPGMATHARRPTGRGWCARNLRREPYPDPAKDGGQS